MQKIKIGILTSSDRASQNVYEDKSGPAIRSYFINKIKNPLDFEYLLCPDEFDQLENALIKLIEDNCSLILTTGGTGPSERDVTVDVTEKVCTKLLPGFGEQMRAVSLKYVPTAILSRQTAGICKNSLIINLPGSPKSINECLEAIFGAIPYCIDLINGPYVHSDDPIVYRPNK